MKRFFILIAMITLLTAAFCICAGAEVFEGRALDENAIHQWEGDNPPEGWNEAFELAAYYKVRYHLDTETGVLRIFCGETYPQKMLQYAKGEWVPWTKDNMRPYIKTVIIEEGLLSVGRFCFSHCENLETVYIPHSVLRVDQTCFYECPKLKNIYYAGTEADFKNYVEFQETRNSYTGGGKTVHAKDLVRFGESVTVICRNQDGETFRAFTVGGYAPGDPYTIVAETFEGLTLVSKKNEISGKFKKGDTKVIEFDYTCNHSYALKDEKKLCSSACIYCGCGNPDYMNEHTWQVTYDTEKTLTTDREVLKKCTVCEVEYRIDGKTPMIWYGAAAAGAVIIVIAIVCAIVIPIRKKKKLKEMTW